MKRGRLYVIATPIGNLSDMTPRAVEALRSCDLVACEDTRRTRALLTHFGVSVPTLSHHKFNEAARLPEILAHIEAGRSVGLVTDAGTPGVSDPGARLVAAAHEARIEVEAIPGASAPAVAMSIAGFEAGGFVFAGYPPSRRMARRRFLEALRASEQARAGADPSAGPWPIVLFEAPHRIEACLADLAAAFGERTVVAIREMTKVHEEMIRGSVSQVLADLRARPRKGEFTLVVEGSVTVAKGADRGQPGDMRAAYEKMIASGTELHEALKRLARETGLSRNEIYRVLSGRAGEPESAP